MFNSAISWKSETQYLGILIGDKLSGKFHNNYVHCKISKLIGLMHKVSSDITLAALKHFTIVSSTLFFVWNNSLGMCDKT